MNRLWLRQLRPQFSLRSLVLFMVVVFLMLGLVMQDLNQRWGEAKKEWQTSRDLGNSHLYLKYETRIPYAYRPFVGARSENVFTHVVGIDIGTKDGFDDEHIRKLASFTRLRILDLSGTHATEKSLSTIVQFQHLRVLSLKGLPITDESVPTLARLNNLETLSLAKTRVTGRTMSELAQLPKLRSLDLSGNFVSIEGWAQLKKLTELKSLCIEGTHISPVDLDSLCDHLPNLELLNLDAALIFSEGSRPWERSKNRLELVVFGSIPDEPGLVVKVEDLTAADGRRAAVLQWQQLLDLKTRQSEWLEQHGEP